MTDRYGFQIGEIDAQMSTTKVYTNGITSIGVEMYPRSSSSTFLRRPQLYPFKNETLVDEVINDAADSGTR